MEIGNKINESMINNNINIFKKIEKIQSLIKKESSLKELCNHKLLIINVINLIL